MAKTYSHGGTTIYTSGTSSASNIVYFNSWDDDEEQPAAPIPAPADAVAWLRRRVAEVSWLEAAA